MNKLVSMFLIEPKLKTLRPPAPSLCQCAISYSLDTGHCPACPDSMSCLWISLQEGHTKAGEVGLHGGVHVGPLPGQLQQGAQADIPGSHLPTG